MLAAFGFESMGVVVGDMYFVDRTPLEGQETPNGESDGTTAWSTGPSRRGRSTPASPIAFARPVWRVDLSGPPRARPGRWTGPTITPVQRVGAQPPELRPRAVSRPAVLVGR